RVVVHRVDLALVDEGVELDRARRLDLELLELVVLDGDEAPVLDLVAAHQVLAGELLSGDRVVRHHLDAVVGLPVEVWEREAVCRGRARDRGGGGGGGGTLEKPPASPTGRPGSASFRCPLGVYRWAPGAGPASPCRAGRPRRHPPAWRGGIYKRRPASAR